MNCGIRNLIDCYEILTRMSLPKEPCSCNVIHYDEIKGSTDDKTDPIQGFSIQRINRDVWRVNLLKIDFWSKSVEMNLTNTTDWLYKLRKWYNHSLTKQLGGEDRC